MASSDSSKQSLPQKFRDLYKNYEQARARDPFASPIMRLSFDIAQMLDHEEVSMDDLSGAIKELNLEALKTRGENLAHYLGTCAQDQNQAALNAFFKELAIDKQSGDLLSFADFQKRIGHVFYGFVFTAHPTFCMAPELASALCDHAAKLGGSSQNEDTLEALKQAADKPYNPPNIHEETALSLEAIDYVHQAIREMMSCFFKAASDLYPDQWLELRPKLCSVATWVGFDMDGRMDIQWATTFEKRIELQIRQLENYNAMISDLRIRFPEETKGLEDALTSVQQTLAHMEKHHAFFKSYNQNDDEDLELLQTASRAMIETVDDRLLNAEPLLEAVQQVLKQAPAGNTDLLQPLLILRSEIDVFGLSYAQVHFRINANQVQNAINQLVPVQTHPDNPAQRRVYRDSITKLLKDVKPANIDFGDIAGERMTAKYEFMLIQQIISYIDSATPVRFLIAETESSFTLLAALYYAKRFGVDKHVDICPLFETERALQGGARYIERLLDNPIYSDYLKMRGRLCIQTGYSDAGRYIGQPGAGASIERLKERMAKLLAKHKKGDIGLLFFDTHGESIGRGGHPDSIKSRIRYISSPYFLKKMAEQGREFTQESSYQGGDGYLLFLNNDAAFSIVTKALTTIVSAQITDAKNAEDPYYQEPARSNATAFFTEGTTFQTRLLENKHYANLLGSFSTNIMHPSGSRAVKRSTQSDKMPDKPSMRQFRAIPHNAILEQFGVLSNTISGMGRAFRMHPNFVEHMEEKSHRFGCFLSLIDRGLALSNPEIMKAYIRLLDPTFWATLAAHQEEINRSNKYAAIAISLEKHDYFNGMMEIFRALDWDYTLLMRYRGQKEKLCAENLACLHAVRLAIIQRMFMLATDIPRYGPHHVITRDQLLRLIFQMDVDRVIDALKEIFPDKPSWQASYDFGEPSDYREQEDSYGYVNIRDNIVKPLCEMQKMTRDISTAVSHFIGFFG